ncbi:MAG: amino acid adenylation domain-containing protein, partial [Myxococcota bacterium]
LGYWTARAATLPGGPALPLARPPAGADQRSWRRLHHLGDPATWRAIKAEAAARRLTPSVVLAAAYAKVLAQYAKTPRFCLNVTLFNRLPLVPDVDQLAGDFTSLVPLEVEVGSGEAFVDLTRRVEGQLWSDLDHRRVSGVRVLREVAKLQGADAARLPVVFTSTLSLDGDSALDALESLVGGTLGYGISQTPQVWLDHQIAVQGGALRTNWDFVADLFPSGLVDAMFAAYVALVESLAAPDGWTEAARPAAVGVTDLPIAPDRALHAAFVARAAEDPDRPALFHDGRTLSYGALLAAAVGVAEGLAASGLDVEQPVLVGCGAPPDQVAAVLGISLAGGWYVPVPPSVPDARLAEIQRVVGARFAVADGPRDGFGTDCAVLGVRVDDRATAPSGPPTVPPLRAVRSEALAYVLFTSGSTGTPKGVAMTHGAALHTIDAMDDRFGVGPETRVLALSALGFDLSVYDVFGVLGRGGALVYPRADRSRDPDEWDRVARAHGVTLWNSVPALGQMYADHLAGLGRRLPPSLAQVWWSGDWIPVELPGAWRALADQPVRIVSLGGATEAGIWSIAFEIDAVDPRWTSIPYGRALRGQRVEILDAGCDPRPDWVVGEIGIAGASLAQAYLGRPDETARRFVHDRAGLRWYRTGDLGRRWPDGTIEFLGREDGQVKVRGHRIETAEIEVRLARSPAVREVAVVAWGPGNHKTELVAFVGLAPGRTDPVDHDLAVLRDGLAAEV